MTGEPPVYVELTTLRDLYDTDVDADAFLKRFQRLSPCPLVKPLGRWAVSFDWLERNMPAVATKIRERYAA